ncbi:MULTISPECIES: A24 family peptidase [unclassified Streptomyces]|uniref:prepilin peptidase n=1 Tax=unclassified Streptomyces TaxID=2593676 RepID=UPI000F4A5555|nr:MULTISPECIES: A24 family peptidase [unclassified Streptomyces]MCX4770148.1 A24 family peptidase [Streptomyces sp. NBC_01285]
MYAMLIGVAALWGAATGLLVPRAAYRFSVEPEDAWRDACPAGHALTGPGRGWLGSTRCTTCAEVGAAVAVHTATGSGAARPGPDVETNTDTGTDIGTGADSGTDSAAVAPTPYRGGPRYAPSLLVPVVSALGCAAVAATTGARPELAVWLLLAPVAVLLAAIDRRVHRLPDELTLPAAGAAAVLLGIAVLLPEHGGSWLSALLGGVALGAFYFLLFLINPNGMGFGDVKLALSLGVALGWYGWAVVFAGGFAGFLFGAAYGLALMIMRRAGRKTGIPFGPFMIAGALLGILFGGLAA